LKVVNIDHFDPKARGGSNRISNLVLACVQCNTKKGAQPIEVFLAKQPERLAKIKGASQAPA
jgi:5-methylcytosine-specific restriction endonuclease McrA